MSPTELDAYLGGAFQAETGLTWHWHFGPSHHTGQAEPIAEMLARFSLPRHAAELAEDAAREAFGGGEVCVGVVFRSYKHAPEAPARTGREARSGRGLHFIGSFPVPPPRAFTASRVNKERPPESLAERLLLAAERGHVPSLGTLLQRADARDVNATNSDGRTVLQLVLLHVPPGPQLRAVTQHLLHLGADPTQGEGESALTIADRRHAPTAAELRAWMLDHDIPMPALW